MHGRLGMAPDNWIADLVEIVVPRPGEADREPTPRVGGGAGGKGKARLDQQAEMVIDLCLRIPGESGDAERLSSVDSFQRQHQITNQIRVAFHEGMRTRCDRVGQAGAMSGCRADLYLL